MQFSEYFATQFAELRARNGLSTESYLSSFGDGEGGLLNFITNSKSGMYFFYSVDGKFLLKSMKDEEFAFFKTFSAAYFGHMQTHCNSLINTFVGCYSIRRSATAKRVYFMAMESLFFTDLSVDRVYDLKGATKGRMATKHELRRDKVPVRKDLGWINEAERVHVGTVAARLYKRQLAVDAEFLRGQGIMDYSLLLGIHRVAGGQDMDGCPIGKREDLRSPYLFGRCHRGMLSLTQQEVYFGGVIDILQLFTKKKRRRTY